MNSLLDLYCRKFRFENRIELNSFIKEVINIAEKYIYFLSVKGKIYLPFDLSCYDAAIDTTSELFKTENNQLIKFSLFFEKINLNNEDEIIKHIKTFIYTVVQNNLSEIYKSNDPITYKILRNIKHSVKIKGYHSTNLLTDIFIHKNEVDFNYNYASREQLLSIMLSAISIKFNDDTNEFIDNIFEYLEFQNEFMRAVSINDLVWIYKQTYLNLSAVPDSNYGNEESKIYLKLLIDDTKTKFIWKTKKYIIKQKFSEEETESMYNILDEVAISLIAGERKKSVRELVVKYFDKCETDHIYNKVEYFLQLFTNDLIEALKRENLIKEI